MLSQPDISFLVSPKDRSPLARREDGSLIDASGNVFPVVSGIPRFVESSNYADSFGLQWNLFSRTQLDKFNGTTISRDRFFAATRWNPESLRGQKVLEVGSGSGRFTQIVLDAGAEVFSVDCSSAVDANMQNNGPHPRLHLCQASAYDLPFQEGYFDRIFCFGVLQHTPDPARAFSSMVPFLKPGGELAADVYPKTWRAALRAYRWYRPLTRRMNPERLLRIIRRCVPLWLPISTALLRLPRGGHFLSQLLPIANYVRAYPQLSPDQQREWSVLDTFDNLTPEYDKPQTLNTVRRWLEQSNLDILYCGPGGVGYVGIGRKRK